MNHQLSLFWFRFGFRFGSRFWFWFWCHHDTTHLMSCWSCLLGGNRELVANLEIGSARSRMREGMANVIRFFSHISRLGDQSIFHEKTSEEIQLASLFAGIIIDLNLLFAPLTSPSLFLLLTQSSGSFVPSIWHQYLFQDHSSTVTPTF